MEKRSYLEREKISLRRGYTKWRGRGGGGRGEKEEEEEENAEKEEAGERKGAWWERVVPTGPLRDHECGEGFCRAKCSLTTTPQASPACLSTFIDLQDTPKAHEGSTAPTHGTGRAEASYFVLIQKIPSRFLVLSGVRAG